MHPALLDFPGVRMLTPLTPSHSVLGADSYESVPGFGFPNLSHGRARGDWNYIPLLRYHAVRDTCRAHRGRKSRLQRQLLPSSL